MERTAMMAGSLLLAFGILLGAFGAHALKEVLESTQLESYETGVRYQIYHGLALIALSRSPYMSKTIFRLQLAGILAFSLSIYFLALDELMGVKLSFLGPITPIGGTLLILSWMLLFINIKREKSTN